MRHPLLVRALLGGPGLAGCVVLLSQVARAQEAGAVVVTMGRRVLRSETAGLVAVTLAMHALGELG